jgi:hypothetical protein
MTNRGAEGRNEMLADIRRLRQIGRLKKQTPLDEKIGKEARTIHSRLFLSADKLRAPQALNEYPPGFENEILAHGLIRASILHDVVVGPNPIDTVGSKTLSAFHADIGAMNASHSSKFESGLGPLLGLPPATMAKIRADVDLQREDSRRKQRLIAAIRKQYDLDQSNPKNLRVGFEKFFSRLLPEFASLAASAELIVTSSLVFICYPMKLKDPLSLRLYERIGNYTDSRLANYPSFGFLHETDIDEDFALALSKESKSPVEETRVELTRSITFLPLDEIEKYLIHDLWGHSWQATLLDFENPYQDMSHYGERISVSGGFASCFQQDGGFKFNPQAFSTYLDHEMKRRLPAVTAIVTAEILADLCEHKLLAHSSDAALHMPNSSLFRDSSVKFDLALDDISYYLGRAVGSFDRWNDSGELQTLANELVEQGASPEEARECVARLAETWKSERVERISSQGGDFNIWAELALGVLFVQSAIAKACNELDAINPQHLEINGFRDVLALCLGVFFETRPELNFWRLGEFCTDRLVPTLRKL